MVDNLTIIITASYIPSHPSIKIMKETIESLSCLSIAPNTNIILAHDYNNNKMYTEYLNNLYAYIKTLSYNVIVTVCKTHVHLTGNIRNALDYVKTKYILVVQHDLKFIKECDIQNIIHDMDENPSMKYIRFNKRANEKKGWDAKNSLFGLQHVGKYYTYTRTPAWSDNNHICLTSYYRDIVMKECKDGGPMEGTLHFKIKDKSSWERYGTYLFGALDYPAIISHLDGRCTK